MGIAEVTRMPTIKDVAKRANVSVATVSRVINNTGYVNIETRQMVEKAIDDLGYVPNELARSLFRKKSNIIGLIVPHISTYFFGELIEAIEDAVNKAGYKLMIFNSKDDEVLEKKYLNVLSQYNVDGLILVANIRSSKSYLKLNIPLLTIDHIIDKKVPSISSDNVQGGALAATKLIESGATNLIHFRGPSDLITVVDRTKGYRSVLQAHNMDSLQCDLDYKNPDPEWIEQFLVDNPDVNGIFCDSDIIAFYVISVLKKLGYDIPNDVQIVGFDNIELSGVLHPKLTTIAQPIDEMGKVAMDLLLAQIKKTKTETIHKVLPVTIIERETTKKA